MKFTSHVWDNFQEKKVEDKGFLSTWVFFLTFYWWIAIVFDGIVKSCSH